MATDTPGTESQKKHAEENKRTPKEPNRTRSAEFNKPDKVAEREWLKTTFDNDFDQLADFAEALMTEADELQKVNEELVERLNRIYRIGFGLSQESKAEPHVKHNMARMSLERDPKDPVARAFISAMQTSKTLTAAANARKGHAPARLAEAFVQKEWAMHRAAYNNNKSAFSRDYVKRVLNEMDVKVTGKQMCEVWLKDSPAASKPAGQPAGGE